MEEVQFGGIQWKKCMIQIIVLQRLNEKYEREIKVKTVLVDDIWCCTATDGVQSVTACGSYPCTRAKEALKKLQQTA